MEAPILILQDSTGIRGMLIRKVDFSFEKCKVPEVIGEWVRVSAEWEMFDKLEEIISLKERFVNLSQLDPQAFELYDIAPDILNHHKP